MENEIRERKGSGKRGKRDRGGSGKRGKRERREWKTR